MTIAMTDYIDLYYEVAGSGPEVLFISGTGGDLRSDPSPIRSPLTDHFTVAAYDQRGLGQSSLPDGPYSIADYVVDAVDLLDDVGWTRAHVVGENFGGMVAQELAIQFPERVGRLVLCGSTPGRTGDAPPPLVDAPPSPDDRGVDWQLDAWRRHDAIDRLGQIASPVLVCGASDDAYATVADQALLAEGIPDSRLVCFAGDHGFLHDDPTAWPVVIDFLEG